MKGECIDTMNTSISKYGYIVYCLISQHIVIPTSCSCGAISLFRFTSNQGSNASMECFCFEGDFSNGYARAFCCDHDLI